ncbi:MAG: hypothetical protein SFU53_11035 [Terrimicrobiaceae bacterium]|nr:hypothetical protein [Terrimicrobiaceae bacterium]
MFRKIVILLTAGIIAAQAADPVEFGVGAFQFERPEGWQWIVPSSAMRKAQLNVPGQPEAAEVTFFHFGPGQGGGVQANVDRWFGQFQNGTNAQAREAVGQTNVTFVEATGTFMSGMPGGPLTPKDGYALRGAILESPGGDVYVKMTGPADVIIGASEAFAKMVRNAASR